MRYPLTKLQQYLGIQKHFLYLIQTTVKPKTDGNLGISENGRLLIVIHTFHEEDEDTVTIRIISGRKATKQEIKIYGE